MGGGGSGRAHLLRGVETADSWATDAHKWLNVPYDSGLVFVRDPESLHAAMGLTAAYLPSTMLQEPSAHTPELSRRARGVEVWAALRTLGRAGVADLVERDCRHASAFALGLGAAGYEILNEVVLNQVLVSFGDEETTRRVIAAIQDDGTCWAESRSGRDGRRCASASPAGRPRRTTWSGVSRRCCVQPRSDPSGQRPVLRRPLAGRGAPVDALHAEGGTP